MNDAKPTILYKFRSLSGEQLKFTQDIFLTNRLWLAAAETLNDPLEARANYQFSVQNDWEANFLELSRRYEPNMSEAERMMRAKHAKESVNHPGIKALMDGQVQARINALAASMMGIVSFSATVHDMKLWAHYGDSHKGIAIGFSDMARHVLPVIYVDQKEKILIGENSPDNWRLPCTKLKEWEHEKEWRYVTPDNRNCPLHFPPDNLTEVVLGARISRESEELVSSWISGRNTSVKVRKATLWDVEPHLRITS